MFRGVLYTPKIKIEEGGVLDGACKMMKEEENHQPPKIEGEVTQVNESTMSYRMKS